MENCVFCKIVAGEIPSAKVYEDDKMLVFKDIEPKAKVHLLAVPKDHFKLLSEMDGEPYIHIHLTAGRADGTVIGGHLKRAVISATCELVLHTVYGRVPRFYDERTGLNLMEL